MSIQSQALLREVLSLGDDERADIAAELLASLDHPAPASSDEVERLWAEEIDRRGRQVLAGESTTEDWASARERLTEQLSTG